MFLQSPTQVVFHKLESSFTSHASQFSFIYHLTLSMSLQTDEVSCSPSKLVETLCLLLLGR